jgi:hypothetical protein
VSALLWRELRFAWRADLDVAVRLPAFLEPGVLHSPSLVALLRRFGPDGALAIYNAVLLGKRLLFVGAKGVSAGEVSNTVLAVAHLMACATAASSAAPIPLRPPALLASGRVYPYACLTHLEFLDTPGGYIAGVTNPVFESKPPGVWWDVLAVVGDADNEGRPLPYMLAPSGSGSSGGASAAGSHAPGGTGLASPYASGSAAFSTVRGSLCELRFKTTPSSVASASAAGASSGHADAADSEAAESPRSPTVHYEQGEDTTDGLAAGQAAAAVGTTTEDEDMIIVAAASAAAAAARASAFSRASSLASATSGPSIVQSGHPGAAGGNLQTGINADGPTPSSAAVFPRKASTTIVAPGVFLLPMPLPIALVHGGPSAFGTGASMAASSALLSQQAMQYQQNRWREADRVFIAHTWGGALKFGEHWARSTFEGYTHQLMGLSMLGDSMVEAAVGSGRANALATNATADRLLFALVSQTALLRHHSMRVLRASPMFSANAARFGPLRQTEFYRRTVQASVDAFLNSTPAEDAIFVLSAVFRHNQRLDDFAALLWQQQQRERPSRPLSNDAFEADQQQNLNNAEFTIKSIALSDAGTTGLIRLSNFEHATVDQAPKSVTNLLIQNILQGSGGAFDATTQQPSASFIEDILNPSDPASEVSANNKTSVNASPILLYDMLLRLTEDPSNIVTFASFFPECSGGLNPIAAGLFHRDRGIRQSVRELLHRMERHPSNLVRLAVTRLNYVLLAAASRMN